MPQWLSPPAGALAPLLALALQGCGDRNSSVGEPPPAPEASFTAEPTEGVAPLDVAFTNLSSRATAWLWDFGDGAVSSEREPVHRYAEAGTFTVRLTALGAGGSDVEQAVDLVQAAVAIGDPSFEDQLPGSLLAGPWQVVAGGESVVQPVPGLGGEIGMPSSGTQWCELSSAGTHPLFGPPVAGIEQSIQPPLGAHVLQFEAAFLSAEARTDPRFNDFVQIEIGDGALTHVLYARDGFSGSADRSSIHGCPMTPVETVSADLHALFPSAGPKTRFMLRALVGNGGDGNVPSFAYLDGLRFLAPAEVPIQASFTADLTAAGVGSLIAFTDTSSGSRHSWSWDFGDGSASTEQHPVHAYAEEGTYSVRLSVAGPGAGDVRVEQDFIVIDNSQCERGAMQVVSPAGACGATHAVFQFKNDSLNGVSYLWDFGDGTTLATSSFWPVSHAYSAPGDYHVSVTAFGQCFGALGKASTPRTVQVVDPPSAAALHVSLSFPAGTQVSCFPPSFAAIADAAVFRGETVRFTVANPSPALLYTWDFGDGSTASGHQVDHVYTATTPGHSKRTVKLTASNCSGVAQVQKGIKVIQTWGTVYTYLNSGTASSPNRCASCHDGNPTGGANGVMNLSTQATAYHQLRNVAMQNVCFGTPSKRVSAACLPVNNSALSGIVWALSHDVCGQGNMSVLCGCLDPLAEAVQVHELRDWIDFGSPDN